MKYSRILLCFVCLMLLSVFCLSAKTGSDSENDLNQVVSEAKTRTKERNVTAEEHSSESSTTPVKKQKSDKNGNQRMLLTAGGGLSIIIPGAEVIHDGYIDWNKGDTRTNAFVAFGFNLLGNVTFTYQLDNEWSLGGSVNLGYNFMGGPHAQYEIRYINERHIFTYRGMGKLYHSFLADFNLIARSPTKKNGDLILEGGLRLMPTWSFLVYRENGVTQIGKSAYSHQTDINPFTGETYVFAYPGKEATMMAGPNLFVGIDYFINDYFDVIG